MSMNKYMHPRNIYKNAPNFKQLALEFPEFCQFCKTDITGRITIDFKNLETLRCLTCTLLKKDFNIDLKIPLNKLIPTVPLRLNYILWIEDLLTLIDKKSDDTMNGIDIGTGASCIYPLLIARKNHWFMVGSEVDGESLQYAQDNIKRNSLEDSIKLVRIERDTVLEEIFEQYPDVNFNFCMCNPPFFSTTEELHPFFKSRTKNRPHPKNAFCATNNEVIASGGEIQYITKLINESQTNQDRIDIFTTMIGHKSNLLKLKQLLRERNIVSFKQTEFCQGNTTRWGLAWTFKDIDLRKIPNSLVANKKQKPLIYKIQKHEHFPYKINLIHERLMKLFKDLQMSCQHIKHIKNYIEFVIIAYANTWSHQRRRRREKLRINTSSDSNNSTNSNDSSDKIVENNEDLNNTCDKLAVMSCKNKQQKRSFDEDDNDSDGNDDDDDDDGGGNNNGYYNVKKLRTTLDEFDSKKIFLKAKICLLQDDKNDCIGLELDFMEGQGTKDALCQVLQYIKNNLHKTE